MMIARRELEHTSARLEAVDLPRVMVLERALSEVLKEVHGEYDALVKHGGDDNRKLTDLVTKLENAIFELDEEPLFHYATAISSERLFPADVVSATRKIYEVWETRIENEYSRRAIGRPASRVGAWASELRDYHLYRRFTRLIAGELALLAQHWPALEMKRLGFVGSGPFPISALLLHEMTNAHVVSFDRDPVAIDRQRSLLRHLGVEGSFSQVCVSGEKADFSGLDAVVIALLARPKELILRQILGTGASTPVLCRTSFGVRQILYEPYHDMFCLPNALEVRGVRVAGPGETISTILLQPSQLHDP
jgi:hypothetical protein